MTHEGRLAPLSRPLRRADDRAVEWRISDGLVAYADALAQMEARAEAIARGAVGEQVWLLEHPPLYTAGTSAREGAGATLPFPLHATGRGGQLTYHGPGQRVAYVMLDLTRRAPDVRAYVAALERWIIDTLAAFNIASERRADRVGVWVRRPDKAASLDGAPAEDKIAAIGIRIRRWVTFHGIALNVEPDLTHFAAITPCGVSAAHLGVTSLVDLGHPLTMAEADAALAAAFVPIFGPITPHVIASHRVQPSAGPMTGSAKQPRAAGRKPVR